MVSNKEVGIKSTIRFYVHNLTNCIILIGEI